VTLVTKNWSVPTFRTAFWLLRAATRGLDKTWTFPCEIQKLKQSSEILRLNSEPEHPCARRARRRYSSARQTGSQNAGCQGTPCGIDGYRLVSSGTGCPWFQAECSTRTPLRDAMAVRKGRPIDSGLIGVVQRHIDDLGLDHHLGARPRGASP